MMLLLALGCVASAPDPAAYEPGWTLVWSDSFDGAAGTPPDPETWVPDVGGDGWGNEQLEYNTAKPQNASLDGEGRLAIVAIREPFIRNDYTSARLTTKGTRSFGPGRFEADLKPPAGTGLWPGFWMLGTDYDDVGWPDCGEIDIMELRGEAPETSLASVHGPGYAGENAYEASHALPEGSYADRFHTFAVDIDPDHITFWMNDERVHVVRPGDVDGEWVFDNEWFLLLNLAVGGYFLEEPTEETPFPATFLVDEVRVFERTQPPG
jgi:beta-glucanase (GH16 family)